MEKHYCSFLKRDTLCEKDCDYCDVSAKVGMSRFVEESDNMCEKDSAAPVAATNVPTPVLAKCPFCGGVADLRFDSDSEYRMWIECNTCHARGPKTCSADLYDEYKLKAVIEAVNKWNERANDAAC